MKIIRLWVDTETTGFNPKKHDVIEVAAVKEIDGYKHYFYEQMSPLNPTSITESACKVHGISVKEMMSFQHPKKPVEKLIKFLGEHDASYEIAGYNVPFDRGMLFALFSKTGYIDEFTKYFNTNYYCLLEHVRKNKKSFANLPNLKLGTLCAHFGIDLTNAHNALADIGATIKLSHCLGVDVKEPISLEETDMKAKYFQNCYIQFNAEGSIYIHDTLRKDTRGFVYVMKELVRMATGSSEKV